MEHLLGSFVPPPLLLVLVSSLSLLLLTQKSTVTNTNKIQSVSIHCYITY